MSDEQRPVPFEIFRGNGQRRDAGEISVPPAPPWRRTRDDQDDPRGTSFVAGPAVREVVNAALHLRRPILVTGEPGIGKSSVAYAVAAELGLDPVLKWPINSRSTLEEGLYRYDAIGRLQDTQRDRLAEGDPAGGVEPRTIGDYLTLGPLGTAMACSAVGRPCVLLIDEIDKSDIDLPNDLLHVFEDGVFEIPELLRLPESARSAVDVLLHRAVRGERRRTIRDATVRCDEFPFVVLTSNGERELPPAFHRRCLRLDMRLPHHDDQAGTSELHTFLVRVIEAHLDQHADELQGVDELIAEFCRRRSEQDNTLAVDQLLQAVYLLRRGVEPGAMDVDRLKAILLRDLRG